MKELILLFILFLVLSCGARRSEKTQDHVVSKTATTDNSLVDKKETAQVTVSEKTTIDDQNVTVTEETTFEAVDPMHPASYTENGSSFVLQNAKKTTRKTTQKNNLQTQKAIKTDEIKSVTASEVNKAIVKGETKTVVQDKDINRSKWSGANLLWLLLPIGGFYLYLQKTKIVVFLKSIGVL